MNVLRPLLPWFAPTVLVASFGVQVVAAFHTLTGLLAASALTGLAADIVLQRWQPRVVVALERTGATVGVRQIMRDGMLLSALCACGALEAASTAVVVGGLLTFYGLCFTNRAVALLVRRTRTLPVITRNIDTCALPLRPAPAAWLLHQCGLRLLLFSAPSTLGMLAGLLGEADAALVVSGLALSAAITGAAVGVLLIHLLPSWRPPDAQETWAWLDRWLAAYRPTAGMYFSGGLSSAYQADMWLAALTTLPDRPVIILRERFMVGKLAPTGLPIVCIPKAADLLRLEHSTLRVLIHPSNSGKTSHVLRIPTIKHAFVNHGESDKHSSFNPFAKAYDQVWVAGPAARERYARAAVGVEDKDIVEIGRPQLSAIAHRTGATPHRGLLTVLYAPTWEGWTGPMGGSSLVRGGEELISALLADPDVRLLYRPHPLTGSVDPRAKETDRKIRALLKEANTGLRHQELPDRTALRDLAARTTELDELRCPAASKGYDDIERMRLQTPPSPGYTQALAAATAAWEKAYWAASPRRWHHLVDGTCPSLYGCFNLSDLLIADVSSVVCDYLASGKPYAVINSTSLSEEDFRETYPTARAATILPLGAPGVAGMLACLRSPGRDALHTARDELKAYLLGPVDAATRQFQQAVSALAAGTVPGTLMVHSVVPTPSRNGAPTSAQPAGA